MGAGAVLVAGHQVRPADDQRADRDRHREAGVPPAISRRRCVVPADGYFEWYADGIRKVPHFIRREDGGVLAFAGLCEIWRDPRRADDAADVWLWSCTIVTTSATDDLGHLHDRMPMVVPAARRARCGSTP
jgi:putative SOS response-associated peptidase YedK